MGSYFNMPVALLSVTEKNGIATLAAQLQRLGWKILASSGTARTLKEADVNVTEISDYTKSPEVLDGRVKTLHPAIHGGILARSLKSDAADLSQIHAEMIDLVVVNLYPFQDITRNPSATQDEIIENIDIGGVALIRAAAKNYQRVSVIVDPQDYERVILELSHGEICIDTRARLAAKAFRHVAAYDVAISQYFDLKVDDDKNMFPAWMSGYPVSPLRYGENPHQYANLFHLDQTTRPLGGNLLQGKELSYNNLLDLDAAWRTVTSFSEKAACIVKHLSPCGVAISENLDNAFVQALACDPVSAYGGVIAVNTIFDKETAERLGNLFVECIIALGFDEAALSILSKRKNCRLVCMENTKISPSFELRTVNQGILVQSLDFGDPGGGNADWRVITEKKPTLEEWVDLKFAWKACQHVKSNGIVLASNRATVGIGGGQPNRVDSVRIAINRAGERSKGAVMASDGYFPYADSIETAVASGVRAVIQPGGSIRDQESIDAANHHDIAMVFTGIRHFRH